MFYNVAVVSGINWGVALTTLKEFCFLHLDKWSVIWSRCVWHSNVQIKKLLKMMMQMSPMMMMMVLLADSDRGGFNLKNMERAAAPFNWYWVVLMLDTFMLTST